MLYKLIFTLCGVFYLCGFVNSQVIALPNGHAHNDYAKARTPLVDAVRLGFISIEIDVFPTKKGLKVAHIGLEVPFSKTLEDLYFKPLEQLLSDQKGQLFTNPKQRLIFMIDIKKDATHSYQLLRVLCQKYAHLVTTYFPNKGWIEGKVDIILSGHKPIQLLKEDSIQYMRIDGGLDKIGADNSLYPRVSTNYASVLKWRGKGEMPINQRKKIIHLVQAAHANQQKIRFWAMPNNEKVWRTLLELGVDWMNIDKIERFKEFYETYTNE
jgi:hypothetical protein